MSDENKTFKAPASTHQGIESGSDIIIFQSLLEHILNGVAYCRMLYEEGQPSDYIYLYTNPAFEQLTGLKEVTGKRVSEVISGIHQSDPELLKLLGSIVRQWLGLTDKNSFDDYRAAIEARGVLVFRSNGYNGKWQIAKENPIIGFSLYYEVCPVIVIKKQASVARQSFTLMHELGHLLLHKSSSIDDEHDMQSHSGREREANTFAGCLLVPDAFLAGINDKHRPEQVSEYDSWLEPQRKAYDVSGEVILRRLLDVGRLSQEQYGAYTHWKKQLQIPQKDGGVRNYRYREPKQVFGDRFVRTVLDALSARHITAAKASSYLDSLKIEDLHQLEHYL